MEHKELYRHCNPSLVNSVVEDFLINSGLSGSSVVASFDESDNEAQEPIKSWNGKLSNMGFTCVNQNDSIYSFWYQPFKMTSSRHSTINIMYIRDHFSNKIHHIATFIYRNEKFIKVLTGNVDEMYDKVSENLSVVYDLMKVFSGKPQVDFCFEIARSKQYNRTLISEELVTDIGNKKVKVFGAELTWKDVESFLTDELKHKYRAQINGENFNI